MTETTPAMAHLCLLFFSPGITGSSSECVLFPACWNNFIYMCVCGGGGVQLLQSCPTLCDPIDGSPPDSPVPGILQARTLDWLAISFSNAWNWKNKVKSLSRVRLLATPWTAAHQAPQSMGLSRQEYWSGLPLPSPLRPFSYVQFFATAWTHQNPLSMGFFRQEY